MNEINIRSIMNRVRVINQLLTSDFDLEGAEKEALLLYRDGEKVVMGELCQKPLVRQIVSPVVVELGEILSSEVIQNQYSLLLALSKAYRIFIELTWSQCLCRLKHPIPVYNETRQQIIANTQKVISVLPKEEATEIKFELRCAEQAAKWLVPDESMWPKYVNHIFNVAGATAEKDVIAIWQAVREFAKDFEQDWMKPWYLDVYELRWSSVQVTTMESFNMYISPRIKSCLEEGGKNTECLTTIFMSIIENPDIKDENLKWRAFQGDEEQIGLVGLVSCDQDDLGVYINKLRSYKKYAKKIFRILHCQVDRFRKTRHLAMRYLLKLVTNDEYSIYHDLSVRTLKFQGGRLKERHGNEYKEKREEMLSVVEEEVDFLQNKIKEIGLNAKEIDEKIAKLYQVVTRRAGRGDVEEKKARMKELISESKNKEKEKKGLEQERDTLKQIDNSLIKSLESQDREEKQYLNEILSQMDASLNSL